MTIRRYETYKPSGVEWLGEVPSHWEAFRTKTLFEIQKRIAGELGHDVLSVTQKGLKVRDIDSNDGQLSMDYSKYQIVLVDDFVMNHMDLLTGWVDIASQNGVTSPDYRVFSARKNVNLRFFLYVFQNGYAQRIFYALGQGASGLGRWRMPTDSFNDFILPTPPLSEQRAIAAFLDRETAKIDALVEQQRRLIDLLKEKRQALISHAVTKGLNPAAPIKDSGIEWLGEVPAHWEIAAVWMLFSLGRGRVISHQDIADNAGTYPVYSSQTENDGVMGSISTFDFEGDYLTWTTDGANAGTVFRRSGKFNCTNVCGTLKPKENIKLDFFQAVLSRATGFFVRHDINPKLMNNVMSAIRLPVPPLEEQISIEQYLLNRTKGFDLLAREAESAIDLLQERRAALISAAVTGKIDVRDLVPAEQDAA
jgi:type I restriction enzyme S subunit